MTKWFCLNENGVIQLIGEHETFEEADEACGRSCIWLFPEDIAWEWLSSLTSHLRLESRHFYAVTGSLPHPFKQQVWVGLADSKEDAIEQFTDWLYEINGIDPAKRDANLECHGVAAFFDSVVRSCAPICEV